MTAKIELVNEEIEKVTTLKYLGCLNTEDKECAIVIRPRITNEK